MRLVAHIQRQGGLSTASDQRELKEEMRLTQDIATEQDRWNEINQRLEDLERALARR
jgi:hypothetical protein